MKVVQIRQMLKKALEKLDKYDDEERVKLKTSSFFCGPYCLGTPNGVIDIENIEVIGED